MAMMGSRSTQRLTEVRMFLRADSAEALVRLQLQNNLKFSSSFSYTDFYQSPIDKKWYCWFLVDIELLERSKARRVGDSGTT